MKHGAKAVFILGSNAGTPWQVTGNSAQTGIHQNGSRGLLHCLRSAVMLGHAWAPDGLLGLFLESILTKASLPGFIEFFLMLVLGQTCVDPKNVSVRQTMFLPGIRSPWEWRLILIVRPATQVRAHFSLHQHSQNFQEGRRAYLLLLICLPVKVCIMWYVTVFLTCVLFCIRIKLSASFTTRRCCAAAAAAAADAAGSDAADAAGSKYNPGHIKDMLCEFACTAA